MNELDNVDDPCDVPLILRNLKLKSINRLVLVHLNINSLSAKFDQLKLLIGKNIDILVLTETKIDNSFPSAQFRIEGFSMPFRLDRNRFGGGVLIYVREDMPCKQLTKHKLRDDIEGIFVEINLRKVKWLLFGCYHPPLDTYRQIYNAFILAGDFNLHETDPIMSEFLIKNDAKNLVRGKNCFKNHVNPSCIDLFITNSSLSFQNTTTFASGLSDFHKMILTVLKTTFQKVKAKEIVYRNFKQFDMNKFKNDIRETLRSVDNYETFESKFLNVLNIHAPLKKKVI